MEAALGTHGEWRGIGGTLTNAFITRHRGHTPESTSMRTDCGRLPILSEEEKSSVGFMRGIRAIAGAAVIGGIVLIAVTFDSDRIDGELAAVPSVSAPGPGSDEGGLMARDRGPRV